VRGVALLLLGWLVASCAPDYERSAFRCDLDHGCPSGQSCIGGRCRRGVPADAGVECGDSRCDVAEQQCCINGPSARCVGAGDVCPGVGALCDGPEDCLGGELCCADSDTVACFASCKTYVCNDDVDCPTGTHCCSIPGTPWGVCADECSDAR